MRNFFWEGHKGGKLNHLVKWDLTTKTQSEGGLGFGSLKSKNMALLAKWGWRFMKEEDSLWCQVVRSIHGRSPFGWHTSGEFKNSLRSPWNSISRSWVKVEGLAVYKVGNGRRVAFWLDPWADNLPLHILFPRLYGISLSKGGAIADFWDYATSSWSINFRRALKDEEIADFQSLLNLVSSFPITTINDKRTWSLEANGLFSVNSLVKHLSKASPMDKKLEESLWKSKSPRRVNIIIWIMIAGRLNCASVL